MTATTPWAWYADPEVLRREQEAIFRPAWHYVGHAGMLPECGYAAVTASGLPVVLTRSAGTERAFLNVCRHRGAVVAEGTAARETLQCPYHAWTYGLDGRLVAAPRAERGPGFEPAGLGLRPLRLERLGPFLFVCADEAAAPLLEALGPLPALLAGHGVDLDGLVFRERVEYAVEANWKIAVENYLECYHCPVAHPGFSALVDVAPDAYRLEQHGHVWSQVGRARDGEGVCHFHLVWPALKVNVFPGPANLSIGPVWPEGPGRTAGFLDYFFGAEVSEEDARALLELDDEVGSEDAALVASVQRGVETGLIERGVLISGAETLIQSFQRKVEMSRSSDSGVRPVC